MNDLNSVENIEDVLYLKLKNLENKCFEYGYVKENSIKILKKSSGYLNPTIFVPFIEYKLLCSAEVFKPNVNDIYLVDVLSINKIAIMCCIKYTYNKKTIIPVRIIIAKHTQNENLLRNINKGSNIYVKIIGYKFTKESTNIDSIANILSKDEIKNIKQLKLIINNLNNIEHDCKMDLSEIISYTNILKFILNKTTISYNELFIYDFIIKNKITNDTIDFQDKYNNYINNFYKNDTDELNNIINCNIDNNYETNPDEETYPEDDLTLDEDNLDSYDYNYIEDNKKGTYSHKQNYHNLEDEVNDISDTELDKNDSDEDDEEDDEDEEDEEDDEEEQSGEQNEESNEINVLKHNIKT
jgi:hypothetical protein